MAIIYACWRLTGGLYSGAWNFPRQANPGASGGVEEVVEGRPRWSRGNQEASSQGGREVSDRRARCGRAKRRCPANFSSLARGLSAERHAWPAALSQAAPLGASDPEGFPHRFPRRATGKMPMGSAISAGAGTLTVACHGRFPRHGSPRLWNVTEKGAAERKAAIPWKRAPLPLAACPQEARWWAPALTILWRFASCQPVAAAARHAAAG
jgi:hypothetical protein